MSRTVVFGSLGAIVLAACISQASSKEGQSRKIGATGVVRPTVSASLPTTAEMACFRNNFPEVDRYREQFCAAVEQAVISWVELGEELPLDESTIFGRILDAVRAVATIESHGDPKAVSRTGRLGLMQLTPQEGLFLNEGENPEVLFDPHYNIFRGTWYYFVLWMEAYEELGQPDDLVTVDELAVARYYRGGHNVLATGVWSEDVKRYVEKFETAMAGATR